MVDSTVVLPPAVQIMDSDGNPVPGARLNFFTAGTATPLTVHSDSARTVALGSTVYCDSAGYPVASSGSSTRVLIYTGTAAYKLVVTDALSATILTLDNIKGALDTSTFATGSGLATEPVTQITSSRAMVAGDIGKVVQANPTSGNVVFSLLAASTAGDGARVRVRHNGTSGAVSIVRSGSDQIDGPSGISTTLQLATYGDEYLLRSTGAGWVATSSFYIRPGQVTPQMLSSAISGAFVQTGSIIAYPDDGTAPTGYLDCNGQAVSRTTYAELFAIIGVKYGAGDASTTFNLPNYDRMMLRGWSSATAPSSPYNDPDAASRTDRGDGTTGNAIGTKQDDQLGSHTHTATVTDAGHSHTERIGSAGSGGNQAVAGTTSAVSNATTINTTSTNTTGITVSNASTGGSETRPVNVYVRFLIFAGASAASGISTPFRTIRNGSGAPDNALGDDGDYYIDNTAVEIYGPKTAGAWGSGTSLVGTEGDPGAIGPTGPNTGLDYAFATSTSGDPGSGKVGYNNATTASVTAVNISKTGRNGEALSAVIAAWDDSTNPSNKGALRVFSTSNRERFVELTVTGALTDNTTYFTVPVSVVASGATLPAADTVMSVSFARAGDKGADGAGTGDVVGPASSVDNEIALFSSTTGKLIKRASTTGVLKAASGVISAAAATDLGAGRHTIWIPASAMISRTTNGAARGTVETTTNKVMLSTLDFDATTQEYAQFQVRMPKSWNVSTLLAVFTWTHNNTTTNFGVVWDIQAAGVRDNTSMDGAFGTAVTSSDTGGTTNRLYISPVTAAFTPAGALAAEDLVVFQVSRVAADAADTMAIDARLCGVTLLYTTNAITDI